MVFLSLTLPVIVTAPLPPSSNSITAKPKPISRRLSVSCKASDTDNAEPSPSSKLDRRNVLLGLGGLYGVAGLASDPFSIADPLLPPDITKCGSPDTLPTGVKIDCCPPLSSKIVDYRLPCFRAVRVRPAAHMVDCDYISKYELALSLMKALPDDDPRSFKQQAMVHCAYCNGAYDQVGFGDLDIQVHHNWLFFPFHRWYLYFFERILGKLIGDPNFAIPFWNWDDPAGMTMPSMFTSDVNSPLYDVNRSSLHQPPHVIDLNYHKNSIENRPPDEQIRQNLATVHTKMVSKAKKSSQFFGGQYVAGSPAPSWDGPIESTHNLIHLLCGSEKTPNGEDMGNFYSSGRDPLFYCHHSNVDRLWSVWKTLGGKRSDPTKKDWLDASFLFYDEELRLVKVKVRDCTDNRLLGYVYQDVPMEWLFKKPVPLFPGRRGQMKPLRGEVGSTYTTRVALTEFPITLTDKPVTAVVQRPKKGRSKAEKEEEEEVLVVEGIEFDREVAVKFDVYVNAVDEGVTTLTPDQTEFAGSFSNVPHMVKKSSRSEKASLREAISDLLDDIKADDDDSVIVTLMPKTLDPITIGDIKIILD